MFIWLLNTFGIGKKFGQMILIVALVIFGYIIYSAAGAAKSQYDARLIQVTQLKKELAYSEARQTMLKREVEARHVANKIINNKRVAALKKNSAIRKVLEDKVNENVLLQKKVKEFEALANLRVSTTIKPDVSTLDGGRRKVSQDVKTNKVEVLDLSNVEFNGSLRLLHDEALQSCTQLSSTQREAFAIGSTRGSNQTPISVGNFVKAVVQNYCIAGEIKSQLSRARVWAASNCIR